MVTRHNKLLSWSKFFALGCGVLIQRFWFEILCPALTLTLPSPVSLQEHLKQQRASRESKVVLYRKYRVGELPDIQIKHSELIRPFQALAQVWAVGIRIVEL